jgi:hypothetical protein
METLPVYNLLGLQLLSLPEELQFVTSEVFAFRDGNGIRILPGNAESEREIRELRNRALSEE